MDEDRIQRSWLFVSGVGRPSGNIESRKEKEVESLYCSIGTKTTNYRLPKRKVREMWRVALHAVCRENMGGVGDEIRGVQVEHSLLGVGKYLS